jgi:hypothetical protein
MITDGIHNYTSMFTDDDDIALTALIMARSGGDRHSAGSAILNTSSSDARAPSSRGPTTLPGHWGTPGSSRSMGEPAGDRQHTGSVPMVGMSRRGAVASLPTLATIQHTPVSDSRTMHSVPSGTSGFRPRHTCVARCATCAMAGLSLLDTSGRP